MIAICDMTDALNTAALRGGLSARALLLGQLLLLRCP